MLNNTNFLKHHSFSLLTLKLIFMGCTIGHQQKELNVQVIDYANQTLKISYPTLSSIAFNM